MQNIIEYINVKWEPEKLEDIYKNTLGNWDPRGYIECGAKSHVMDENENFKNIWEPILSEHSKVHDRFCPKATGFNYNATPKHTVPPHIDIDEPLYFNLLLPVFGVAKINIYETIDEQLEHRHGMTHWKMVNDKYEKHKIGEVVVDKPVLLNTDQLHDVEPIDTPRCLWCTRWVEVPQTFTYATFKEYVEDTLND